VTNICDYCFSNCVSLQNISLPENLNIISTNCFEYCFSLETIVLPQNLEKLGDYCFSNCITLKNVTLSNNLTSFGNDCFYDDKSITNFNILNYESLTYAGANIFNNSGLKTLNYYNCPSNPPSPLSQPAININASIPPKNNCVINYYTTSS
jgi:hypothetical protein